MHDSIGNPLQLVPWVDHDVATAMDVSHSMATLACATFKNCVESEMPEHTTRFNINDVATLQIFSWATWPHKQQTCHHHPKRACILHAQMTKMWIAGEAKASGCVVPNSAINIFCRKALKLAFSIFTTHDQVRHVCRMVAKDT